MQGGIHSNIAPAVGDATVLAAHRSGSAQLHAPSNPPPPAEGLLTRAQISYVGCFGIFSNSDAAGLSFAEGCMTARKVGGDLKFLYTGAPSYNFPLIEIYDPGTYSTNYLTAPRTSNSYINWGNAAAYGGSHRTSWEAGGSEVGLTWYPGSMLWHDENQLLYMTYYDTYNVSGRQDWAMMAVELNNPIGSVVTPHGPWRLKCTDGDGNAWYGDRRGTYLYQHPTTGKILTGASISSGNVSATWGPCCFHGADFPTPSTPAGYGNPDLVMPDDYLNHYYPSNIEDVTGTVTGALRTFRRPVNPAIFEPGQHTVNPALYGGVGSWGQLDGMTHPVWLELTNRRGVLFFGSVTGAVSQDPGDVNAGHCWYANEGLGNERCSHGFLMPVQIAGPVSTHNFPCLAIYDPDDLEAVKNTALDYTPEPIDFINLETEYNIQCASESIVGGSKSLSFIYWDPDRNYLFALAHRADSSYMAGQNLALIHVFHIADVA